MLGIFDFHFMCLYASMLSELFSAVVAEIL